MVDLRWAANNPLPVGNQTVFWIQRPNILTEVSAAVKLQTKLRTQH